jgi:hypothetical protein
VAEYDPSLEEAIDELLSKLKQILLKPITLDQLSSLEVVINVLGIDLLDREPAEVTPRLSEDGISKLDIDVPKAKGTKLRLVGLVLIALIEN